MSYPQAHGSIHSRFQTQWGKPGYDWTKLDSFWLGLPRPGCRETAVGDGAMSIGSFQCRSLHCSAWLKPLCPGV